VLGHLATPPGPTYLTDRFPGIKSATESLGVLGHLATASGPAYLTDRFAGIKSAAESLSVLGDLTTPSGPTYLTDPFVGVKPLDAFSAFGLPGVVSIRPDISGQPGLWLPSSPTQSPERSDSLMRWAGSARPTVAIVFTDIVGYTALAYELGDDEIDVIRRAHFRQARMLLRRHGGFEVKTMGDGLLVAFHTVIDALGFVLELFMDPGHRRVAIRAGVHHGGAHIEESDLFGTAVNYAARVSGSAKGAEIWISDAAKQVIDTSNSDRQLVWSRHADQLLKGLPGVHTLWSLELH
jgi:class 3 adenylate cyclase